MSMQIITIDQTNYQKEHICCAIGNDQSNLERCNSKRNWMAHQFANGLVFKRLDDRGKVFIEYMPIETVWKPLIGTNILVINCLWVAGRFKGQGIGSKLLSECVADAIAMGKTGIAVVSSTKKKPFLTDKAFFTAHGFNVVDTALGGFELLYRPLQAEAVLPTFSTRARLGNGGNPVGFTFVYSRQCPFMASVVETMAEQVRIRKHSCGVVELSNYQQAQAQGSPFGTLGIYLEGRLLTHELMPAEKFEHLLDTVS